MTLTVEDDFREFVAARWPDLEGVAFVVTLDVVAARRVTTEAFATLHQRWREALDDGRPGSHARRSVLRGAVAAAPEAVRPGARRPAPGADPDDDDPVLTALEGVLRDATALERALVAAASVWGAGPDEVADLLGMPAADVRERATALRSRLAAAHDTARAAEGLDPADWALDDDLDAVVERLLAGQGDPPDPAALVEDRRRAVRRRSLVTGGAAALAAGAAGWWLLGRGPATTCWRPRGGRVAGPAPLARRPELGAGVPLGAPRPARRRRARPGPRHQPRERRRPAGLGRRRAGAAGRRLGDAQPGHRGRHRAGLGRCGRGRPGHPGRGAPAGPLRRR